MMWMVWVCSVDAITCLSMSLLAEVVARPAGSRCYGAAACGGFSPGVSVVCRLPLVVGTRGGDPRNLNAGGGASGGGQARSGSGPRPGVLAGSVVPRRGPLARRRR